ncbi:hypothetical protein [Thalassotalea piscium]|uniref:DUF4252 domain-containing protein n=1 Tax=Thalassotalea piscium TaxID=1230533 RepID=A0A7X0TVB7_9GAMM|nr:hypothetical protein [Thalassotalea piscium]MBB6544965.1 hypothetical protein [Thalassotalea piscium]
MKIGAFIILLMTSYSIYANPILKLPSTKCYDNYFSIRVVDLFYCVSKHTIEEVYLLGITSTTAVIKEGSLELSIGLNPPEISISNLHKKLGLTVHEFFMGLYSEDLDIDNFNDIKSAFDINSQNKLSVYSNGNLYAFVIIGSNVDYDRIYLNKKGSDIVYQVTGEFSGKQLLNILSKIKY